MKLKQVTRKVFRDNGMKKLDREKVQRKLHGESLEDIFEKVNKTNEKNKIIRYEKFEKDMAY